MSTLTALETTELAAGNAPDVLDVKIGCGTLISVCELAKDGDLAPLVKVPWTKWSLPAVTSADKVGPVLYAFLPTVTPYGIFTNDPLFKKLGLAVPQTFAQLLTMCQRAKADGTTAVLFNDGNATSLTFLIYDLAAATVYAGDPHWHEQLKAGTASFDGAKGWHLALQEVIDMNDAGCFEPGVTGTTNAEQLFAEGEGLMLSDVSNFKATIDADGAAFGYSFYPFPGGTSATQVRTIISEPSPFAVNAHSSAASQAAAQTFIDFIARPKQNALYAQIGGAQTQYEFLKQQLPAFMSPFEPVLKSGAYILNPQNTWWNADVQTALQTGQIGLLTGQSTIDGILQAMDAAWKEGPS
jgi:raffinose/stachyose/melibiose transport system substrate-binding protein